MMATNIDECGERGGLDETHGKIVANCKQNDIPLIYALRRRTLGKALGKHLKMSSVAVLNADDASVYYKELLVMAKERKQQFINGKESNSSNDNPNQYNNNVGSVKTGENKGDASSANSMAAKTSEMHSFHDKKQHHTNSSQKHSKKGKKKKKNNSIDELDKSSLSVMKPSKELYGNRNTDMEKNDTKQKRTQLNPSAGEFVPNYYNPVAKEWVPPSTYNTNNNDNNNNNGDNNNDNNNNNNNNGDYNNNNNNNNNSVMDNNNINNKNQFAIVPFSHTANWSEALKLPKRNITLFNRNLVLEQDWKDDGKGGSNLGFGASIYPSAILLASYFEKNQQIMKNKTVLELGAGVGLCGIAAYLAGAKKVCITDGDDELLKLIKKNVKSNINSYDVHTSRLLWGDMNDHAIIQRDVLSTSLNNKFDVIFGSDIVACPYVDALNSLIETLEYYFNENPKLLIYISYKRRNESENNYFWNIIQETKGWKTEDVNIDMFEGMNEDLYLCKISN